MHECVTESFVARNLMHHFSRKRPIPYQITEAS